ncbi:DNA-binding transcriptional regulator, LacI/PurR family [Klenkia soli]|uniref:DNA-binding transcriptional regulator, LacI/PurR family n=1 Tax=Klenkia soli TaxID=1052260 RepID=A0A1H0P521_9ACTN|nr:DNA-binding transcriptional regulator, LacI/PurR family [Klenkia soli]
MTGSEVAAAAGVSPATVSYVLNDTPGQSIPESTRTRVREAAARLGYQPNAAARSLRVGRSDVVVGLVPDTGYSATFSDLMLKLSRSLSELGLSLVLHPAPLDPVRLRELLRTIDPVGVVALTGLDDDTVTALQAAGVRVVVGTAGAGAPRAWEIRFGAGEFGAAQAQHLRSRGHERIGLVRWARDFPSATDQGRAAALLEVMAVAGQTHIPVLDLPADPGAAEQALGVWLRDEPAVTAVATMDDDVAALVVSSADRLGVAVPDRLAVVGAYDFPVCTLVRPALSTVRADLGDLIGRFAAIIHEAVADAGSPLPDRIAVDTARVVARGST